MIIVVVVDDCAKNPNNFHKATFLAIATRQRNSTHHFTQLFLLGPSSSPQKIPMFSSATASYSMWRSEMGGNHRSSTFIIVAIVLTTTTLNLILLPSPVSSFVLRPSPPRAMSAYATTTTTTTTTTSLYVSRKDRYSSTIINRSRDSAGHHHRRGRRPFATAASDTAIITKKKGSGAMEDHWSDLWQPESSNNNHQRVSSSSSGVGVIIPIQNEIDIALLQRHLIEGIIEHQTLLDSVYQHDVESQSHATKLIPQQQSSSSSSSSSYAVGVIEDASIQTTTTTTTQTKSTTTIIPMLSDVWKARLLLLLSAALYGTNFTLVKSIDDIPGMSVGLASTFRFGFAALVMLPLLFTPSLEDEEHTSIMTLTGEEPTTTTTTRLSIIVAGMEIGLYNSIGYLFQAEGLKTTTASKVRDYYM